MNDEATAARIATTVTAAISLQRSRTPASHLVNVRWSLANDCSAVGIQLYLRRAIAIATKLAATCAIDPIVAM